MKKIAVILILMILVVVFVASCALDHVYYCPYCSRGGVEEISKNVFKCGYCDKEFGAKEIKVP